MPGKSLQGFSLFSFASPACVAAVFAVSVVFPITQHKAHAATYNTASLDELDGFAMEDLMQVQAFSVSKQPEHVFTAASAIYVITAKNIHDAGVTSLPEALRLAPGVQVSKVNVNQWAVSIRGFAGRFSNKLLVLQDGRTLYNPLFSGVYWDEHEIMLEDIEQIEVIRGPGATLWGANAVNGVINITTKSAKNTQGGLVTASGGTAELGAIGLRYGAKIGENVYLRVYGKTFYRENEPNLVAPDKEEYCTDRRGGFRADWRPYAKSAVTVQGDIYDSFTGVTTYSGKNILGRWNRIISDTSELNIQLYYDRTDGSNSTLHHFERYDTSDFDLQHTFALGTLQKIVWGTGVRVTYDELNNNNANTFVFIPTSKTQFLYSAFIQNSITLLPETVNLILGSRVEHNDTTGWEFMPTARLAWTPSEQHTLWSAVSRAVRTPSRVNTTISYLVSPARAPFPEVRQFGNPNVPSEKMIAYEAGYRYQPLKTLSFDLALFYNDYSSLAGLVWGGPSASLIPINVASTSSAIGKGGELSVDWHPQSWLDAALTYSYLDMSVKSSTSLLLNKLDFNRVYMGADTAPRHQFSTHATVTLPYNIKCTLWLRYVDELKGPGAPEYVTMDARIAWKPLPDLELSVAGQNLIEPKHFEYGPDASGFQYSPVARSMYGKVAWSF